MDIQTLQTFFGWCTVLNLGVLIVGGLLFTVGADFVYWVRGKLFTISRETFDTVAYCSIALYKLVVIAFGLVPWIALEIIGKLRAVA